MNLSNQSINQKHINNQMRTHVRQNESKIQAQFNISNEQNKHTCLKYAKMKTREILVTIYYSIKNI